MVVDVDIAAAPGIELRHPGNLALVLGGMRLEIDARMLVEQPARQLELALRRRWCEARRHRVEQAVLAMPLLDQRLAVRVSGIRGVAQELRTVAVHRHLAGNHAQTAGLGSGEERVGRLRMNRGEDQGCRGAVAQELGQEEVGDFARVLGVGEAPLDRERIALEPFEELLAVGGDDVGLRIVDVRVDEARHDQLAGIVGELHALRQPGQQRVRRAGSGDLAVVQHQQAVVEILVGALPELVRVADEVEEGAAERLVPRRARCRYRCAQALCALTSLRRPARTTLR